MTIGLIFLPTMFAHAAVAAAIFVRYGSIRLKDVRVPERVKFEMKGGVIRK